MLPPGALSAGADALLRALRRAAGASRFQTLEDPVTAPEAAFVLAPDPASEAREVAREVLRALEAGAGLHEVAVFHGADQSYRALLAQAFESAAIPTSPMPGTPLSETRGRPRRPGPRRAAAQALLPHRRLRLPGPGAAAPVPALQRRRKRWVAALRLAEAGARGRHHARHRALVSGVGTLIADRQADLVRDDISEGRRAFSQDELRQAEALDGVIAPWSRAWSRCASATTPRRSSRRSRRSSPTTCSRTPPAMTAVVAADRPARHHRRGRRHASASTASSPPCAPTWTPPTTREGQLGDGVLVADYRLAAGLSFQHAILCGAYEGVFPAGARQDALVEDRVWTELQQAATPSSKTRPCVCERAREAAAPRRRRRQRAADLDGAAAGRRRRPRALPFAADGRSRESPRAHDRLRDPAAPRLARGWLRRAAVAAGRDGPGHGARPHGAAPARRRHRPPRQPAGRRGAPAAARPAPAARASRRRLQRVRRQPQQRSPATTWCPRGSVSPTSLEHYAACGLRYFLDSVLRLRPPDEPGGARH